MPPQSVVRWEGRIEAADVVVGVVVHGHGPNGTGGLRRGGRGHLQWARMDRARAAAPALGDDWIALSDQELPIADVSAWVIRPDCGAVVTFTGTARDHSPGRSGVHRLEYEAYEKPAVTRMVTLIAEARRRWPTIGRTAVVHRVGPVGLGDAAVVVAVSAPHRAEAFEAARFLIDELKRTGPIWKREAWAGGESWGLEAQHLTEVGP